MNEVVIQAENLSKLYRIRERYRSKNKNPDYIWALRRVSFEIKKGEVVGIIGNNGAGKTTLLKILCRITPPTEGYARVRGRIGALLEVGTGFHPQLTGRDNIYLNGAMLGMKKSEIHRKFDEIVTFSELEKFIDTPLKHYSSGMYVRLAFSVAAHLDSEILLVDEVLAVGDAAFQRRCLGKMEQATKEKRTVLFVSHNMDAVYNLCPKAILLNNGEVYQYGSTDEVIISYQSISLQPTKGKGESEFAKEPKWHGGDGLVRILGVDLISQQREPKGIFNTKEGMVIKIRYVANKRIENPVFGIAIYRDDGTHIIGLNTKISNFPIDYIEGEGGIEFQMQPLLMSGNYAVTVAIHTEDDSIMFDHRHKIREFRVVGGGRISIVNSLSLSSSIGKWHKL